MPADLDLADTLTPEQLAEIREFRESSLDHAEYTSLEMTLLRHVDILLSHIEAQAWRPDLRPSPDCEWCRAGFSLTSDPPKAGRVYHVAPDNSHVDHAPAKDPVP